MDATRFNDLLQRGRAVTAHTVMLQTQTRAGLIMAGQLQDELQDAIAVSRGARPDRVPANAMIAFLALFPAQRANPYEAAKRLIDEFGRRARSVAMARSLVGLQQDDETAALHWRNAFEAVLNIQEPAGVGRLRRRR